MNGSSALGFAIWLTGPPSAGKSTVAEALVSQLMTRKIAARVLDSDALRRRAKSLGYSPADRDRFYSLLVDLAVRRVSRGRNVIIAATGSKREYRARARRCIARFAEVHIDCPRDVCRRRDVKGLYRSVLAGRIMNLPGADADYEPPLAPDARIDTALAAPDEAARVIARALEGRGFFNHRPAPTARNADCAPTRADFL